MKYAGRDKHGFAMRSQDTDERGFMQEFVGKPVVCKLTADGNFRFEVASPEPIPEPEPEAPLDDPTPVKAQARKPNPSK